MLIKDGLQRVAAHEFHPETDAAVNLVSAVDGDDVWMLDFREQPALRDDVGVHLFVVAGIAIEELYRDVAIESRIPRAVHGAELARADAAADLKPAPTLGGQHGRVDRQ